MGTTPKFSIITPVYVGNDDRRMFLQRAIESVAEQTGSRNFEHIIVNDGSPLEFEVPKKPWIKLINQQHAERVVALNNGLAFASGEWICFLDSDDEYAQNYLETLSRAIKEYPNAKMFNFGCRYKHKDGGVNDRGPFEPEKLDIGHVVFGGGQIVNGTYVFHRSVYDTLGGYPPEVIEDIDCSPINYGGVRNLYMHTPYDFAAAAQMEFPEIREFFMVDHVNEPKKIIKELGNPWGQDFYLFYKYTRKYHSVPLKDTIYIVHPKPQ